MIVHKTLQIWSIKTHNQILILPLFNSFSVFTLPLQSFAVYQQNVFFLPSMSVITRFTICMQSRRIKLENISPFFAQIGSWNFDIKGKQIFFLFLFFSPFFWLFSTTFQWQKYSIPISVCKIFNRFRKGVSLKT